MADTGMIDMPQNVYCVYSDVRYVYQLWCFYHKVKSQSEGLAWYATALLLPC